MDRVIRYANLMLDQDLCRDRVIKLIYMYIDTSNKIMYYLDLCRDRVIMNNKANTETPS